MRKKGKRRKRRKCERRKIDDSESSSNIVILLFFTISLHYFNFLLKNLKEALRKKKKLKRGAEEKLNLFHNVYRKSISLYLYRQIKREGERK